MAGIRFKRGSKVNLPRLLEGEPAICLDTKQVFVGGSAGNVELEAAGKAAEVQVNLATHTNNKSNPHGVTVAQVGAADASLSNVSNANFKSKAESAGAGGQKVFDQVIRTQAEFDALIASPTWLGAVSVCFVGNGGTLRFTRSDGQGIKIPQTVAQIQGVNSAIIEVTNFVYNEETNKAALWYSSKIISGGRGITRLTVLCRGKPGSAASYGFRNCYNLTDCSGSGSECMLNCGIYTCSFLTNCTGSSYSYTDPGFMYGFYGCDHLTDCNGSGDGNSSSSGITPVRGYGFYNCSYINNCTGKGNGWCNDSSSSNFSLGIGFCGCRHLTNCEGSGEGYGSSKMLLPLTKVMDTNHVHNSLTVLVLVLVLILQPEKGWVTVSTTALTSMAANKGIPHPRLPFSAAPTPRLTR